MAKTPKAQRTRLRLLETAAEILADEGPLAVTLDRVAEKAKISKGGLLYHFKTKRSLLESLVDEAGRRFTQMMVDAMSKDPEPHGRIARAYIQASFETLEQNNKITMGIIGIALIEPELMAPLRASYVQWQQMLEADGLSPAKATTLRFIIDGLWGAQTFDLAPAPPHVLEDIHRDCLAMTLPPEG